MILTDIQKIKDQQFHSFAEFARDKLPMPGDKKHLNEIREEVERMGIVTTWVETPKAEQWRSRRLLRRYKGNCGVSSRGAEFADF